MVEFFEVAMLVLFGCSWPFNIVKSYRSGTAKGKSVMFEFIVIAGYLCGLAAKILSGNFYTLPVPFYILDICMVLIDVGLYFRNTKRDRVGEIHVIA